MASITKREGARGTTYRARVKVGGRVRFKSFARLTDARMWAAQVEAELQRGGYVPTREDVRRTVADLVDQYLEDILPTKRHNRDRKNPERHLAWWRAELGNLPLVELTPDIVAKARDKLAKGRTRTGARRTPGTVNRYLVSLSHACRVAVSQWQWMRDNPCRHVPKLQEPRGRTRFLSDDERRRLLDACRADINPDIYDMVLLALATGIRRGELMGLTWSAVDLERRRLVLEDTKNGERRVVPATGPARDMLERRSKIRRIDAPYVFPGRKRGKPLDPRAPFERACKAAGLEGFRWHDLRHTAASYLAMNGATLAELSDILGHKTLAMVKRYAHLSEQHTASVLERMTARLEQ